MSEEIAKLLKEELNAQEIALILFAQNMIKQDELSDLSEVHIVSLASLMALNSLIPCRFIENFVSSFIKFRKSHRRKDRQEIVQMMQQLREEKETKIDKLKKFLGMTDE